MKILGFNYDLFISSVCYLDNNRILFMRQMILAKSVDERKNALSKLEPFQKNDFKSIFKIIEFYLHHQKKGFLEKKIVENFLTFQWITI